MERQELRSQQLQAPQESQPGEPNNSDVGTNLAVIFENYYFDKSLKKALQCGFFFPKAAVIFIPISLHRSHLFLSLGIALVNLKQ